MFLQLSEDRFFERVLPSVLITAKGMPDLSTRAFLHSLTAAFPTIPVLGMRRPTRTTTHDASPPAQENAMLLACAGLVDFNPSGLAILSVYKFGSFRGGLEAPRLQYWPR